MKPIAPYPPTLAALLLAALACASCKSSIERIREINDIQSIPSLRIENLTGRMTELGGLKVRYATPELRQFHFAEEKYTDFPKGIELYRYLDSVTVEASVVADYAIYYDAKDLWEATGNVLVKNMEGDELSTEKLFWNQKTKKSLHRRAGKNCRHQKRRHHFRQRADFRRIVYRLRGTGNIQQRYLR